MRHLYIISFCLFVTGQLPAQTLLDTLCAGFQSDAYIQYCNKLKVQEHHRIPVLLSRGSRPSDWECYPDSTRPINMQYFRVEEGIKKQPLQGWFIMAENSHTRWGMQDVGLSPIKSYTMDNVRRLAKQEREYSAYFDDGVPCSTWKYIYRKYGYKDIEKKNLSVAKRKYYTSDYGEILLDSLYKTETFDNGLLDGKYVVYKEQDTIYQTTFNHGTGRYRDFYVNGKVMLEGDLVDGYRNGVWTYYYYDWEKGAYTGIMIEHYNMGEFLRDEYFVGTYLVREAIKWERETSKWKKRKYRNPISSEIGNI